MKNKDKTILIDGIKYIKYSHVAFLITSLLPVLLLPLMILGVFSTLLVGTLIGFLVIFFAIMKLTQLVFLYNGFNGLNKIETDELAPKAKKGYKITATYVLILIGGWIALTFTDSFFLENLYHYLTSVSLLTISFFTLKVLDDKNVNNQKDAWLDYFIYFLLILETGSFIGLQFMDNGLTYTLNDIDYEAGSVLSIVVSIFIFKKANTYLSSVDQ